MTNRVTMTNRETTTDRETMKDHRKLFIRTQSTPVLIKNNNPRELLSNYISAEAKNGSKSKDSEFRRHADAFKPQLKNKNKNDKDKPLYVKSANGYARARYPLDERKIKLLNSHMDMMKTIKHVTIREMRSDSIRLLHLGESATEIKDELERETKSKFSISDCVSVEYFDPVEDHDKKNVWYTRLDLESFTRDVYTTRTALNIVNNDRSKLDQNKFCLRGIERFLTSSMDRRRRQLINRMIAAQRDFKSKHGGHGSGDHNEELSTILSEMEFLGSEETRENALWLAALDAEIAAKHHAERVSGDLRTIEEATETTEATEDPDEIRNTIPVDVDSFIVESDDDQESNVILTAKEEARAAIEAIEDSNKIRPVGADRFVADLDEHESNVILTAKNRQKKPRQVRHSLKPLVSTNVMLAGVRVELDLSVI